MINCFRDIKFKSFLKSYLFILFLTLGRTPNFDDLFLGNWRGNAHKKDNFGRKKRKINDPFETLNHNNGSSSSFN